jgi:hypothetical protein
LEYRIRVLNGATLTIEPCAVIEVDPHRGLQVGTTDVEGHLVAEGTADRPIIFRPSDGVRWGNVYVGAASTARFAYTSFENGGAGDSVSASAQGATIDAQGRGGPPSDPLVFVDHVTIRNSAGSGVTLRSTATFIDQSTDLTITGSGSDTSPYPVRLEDWSIDRLPSGNYTGNHTDEIGVYSAGGPVAGEGLLEDATIHDRGVPYRMLNSFRVGGGATLVTLTIEPGVELKFERATWFHVQFWSSDMPATAALRAIGAQGKEITFTSAAATRAPGDWGGIWFSGVMDPTNRLDFVNIEFAGNACSCGILTCSQALIDSNNDGAVIINGTPPSGFITNTKFSNIQGTAIVQGGKGQYVDLKPTNDFVAVGRCQQSMPVPLSPGTCPNPNPACD